MLGVDTLVVERNPRVGDNWRNRYDYLSLHDPVWYDHLPYLDYPSTWPVFTPKDKLAGWMEAYAEFLELNVWTGTEVVGGGYDDEQWSVVVRRADGNERTLRPQHVVLATGLSGLPRIPEIPGAADFGGVLCHSSDHTGGEDWAGRRAVVIGTGNTGHDLAQDFQAHGADVTLVQRGSTYVISLEAMMQRFAPLYGEGGPPVEEADLIHASFPFALSSQLAEGEVRKIREIDRELLDGLEVAGFRTNLGVDGRGAAESYVRRAGGYYIDIGCSQLIIDGKVKLKGDAAIERITPTGVRFEDGVHVDADVIVLATGYLDPSHTTRALFGDAVADRLRPVMGPDAEGEIGCLYRDSGQPGYWIMAGNFAACRNYSKYLALKIKALQEGLIAPASSA
jgi:putative flavoprotein involved in K+ transport